MGLLPNTNKVPKFFTRAPEYIVDVYGSPLTMVLTCLNDFNEFPVTSVLPPTAKPSVNLEGSDEEPERRL